MSEPTPPNPEGAEKGPQRADFSDLLRQAAAVESASTTQGGTASSVSTTVIDVRSELLQELLQGLQLIRASASGLVADFEEIAPVWGDPVLRNIASALADVCMLHGLTAPDVLKKWGPYINLAFAVGAPAVVTLKWVQAKREQQAQKEGPSSGNAEQPKQA